MPMDNDLMVSIDYEVRVNGDLVDSSGPGEPLRFLSGRGKILPSLEAGIAEMAIGEEKVITVLAKDAYGEYFEDAKDEVPVDQFEGVELEVGTPIQGRDEQGRMVQATVIAIKEKTVIIDYNHPLAGHDMEFKVRLAEIRQPTEAELEAESSSAS
jgi:FKBP-type peptidyl-prolyl cis-trans isomerase SlyD